jgi:hypothetical protein
VITYRNQQIRYDSYPRRSGPKEPRNIFQSTQNKSVADLEFIECELLCGGLFTHGAPVNRSSATNIQITNCRGALFHGNGAVFDEVIVNGIRTSRGPVLLFASAFRHVVVKGTCNGFLFNRNICHDDSERNEAFISANQDFYRNVDWALDISQMKCSGFELRGSVPVELIRRNLDEHFIMSRDVAQSGAWKEFEPFDVFQSAISMFLASDATTELFVAPRRSKKFKEYLEYYQRLKAAGLVS